TGRVCSAGRSGASAGHAFWQNFRARDDGAGAGRNGRSNFMTDVVMPQMGESIVEGTLTKWLKKAGDKVGGDEPLFEIPTEQVDTEIPSPTAGTLSEVLVEEGKTVGINTVVARIDDTGGNGARPAAAAKPAAAAPPAAPPKT